MKFSNEEIITYNKEYLEIVEGIETKSQLLLNEINSKKFDKKEIKDFKIEVAFYLRTLHIVFMVCKNDKLLLKLKEFKLTSLESRWFVSLSEIKDQFDLIEAKGIIIDKPQALYYIIQHLHTKFLMQLITWATKNTSHDGVAMNLLTKYLFDLKKRRQYNNGNPRIFKNLFDMAMNSFIIKTELETENKVNLDYLLLSSKGKIENIFLTKLIKECFDYDNKKLSNTKFLSSVYDLFRIIMQDYYLKDEKEFFNKKDILEHNFDIYKAKRLKKVIYKE